MIHSAAQIGANCWICRNVTIGRKANDKHVPKIGNNVYIAANSVVVGEIEIGDNCVIGTCSFVNKSVPLNSLVFGVPAVVKGTVEPDSRPERNRR